MKAHSSQWQMKRRRRGGVLEIMRKRLLSHIPLASIS